MFVLDRWIKIPTNKHHKATLFTQTLNDPGDKLVFTIHNPQVHHVQTLIKPGSHQLFEYFSENKPDAKINIIEQSRVPWIVTHCVENRVLVLFTTSHKPASLRPEICTTSHYKTTANNTTTAANLTFLIAVRTQETILSKPSNNHTHFVPVINRNSSSTSPAPEHKWRVWMTSNPHTPRSRGRVPRPSIPVHQSDEVRWAVSREWNTISPVRFRSCCSVRSANGQMRAAIGVLDPRAVQSGVVISVTTVWNATPGVEKHRVLTWIREN